MSKGLEALKHLYAKLSCKSSIEDIDENLQEYDIIEKELKALEIIKDFISLEPHCIYGKAKRNLTQEEYDLLKEVLNNESDPN